MGRHEELHELGELLERAVRGRGRMVLVEGAAGIGKSALLAASLSQAHALGLQVFKANAHELERHRPFGVVADGLNIFRPSPDPARACIAELLLPPGAEGRPHHGDHIEYQVAEAMRALLEHLVTAGPVVFALEDLHWADAPSLLVLQRLARVVSQWPALIVATTRPVAPGSPLATLVSTLSEHGGCRRVLGPLPLDDVIDLSRSLLGRHPGPNLGRLLGAAEGNPLFVLELLKALEDPRAVHAGEGDTIEIGTSVLPPPLTVAILGRLSQLSPATLETLQFASVLGSTFLVDDLAAFLARPATELAA
jgi:predicted ATPase